MIPQTRPSPGFHSPLSHHLHIDGDTCPWCEQDIPPEKLEEIRGKIALRQHEQAAALTTSLRRQFELDKAQAIDVAWVAAEASANQKLEEVQRNAQETLAKIQKQFDDTEAARKAAEQNSVALKTQITQLQEESAAREAVAVDAARKAADLAANEKLAEVQRVGQETLAKIQSQFDDAEAARRTAEQNGAALKTQMAQLQVDNVAAIEAVQTAAKAREAAIHTEARQAADAAVADQIANLDAARLAHEAALKEQIQVSEQTKAAAEAQRKALGEQIQALQRSMQTQAENLKAEAEIAVATARKEAKAATEAALQHQLEVNIQAATEATTKAQAAETKLSAVMAEHETTLAARLAEQREALEKATEAAVNEEKRKYFDENLKLTNKVEELKRALEKKSNEELGEGAELEIFEALKAEFPNDDIKRIPKGTQGADIRHVVMLNDKPCGSILYDSKNHGQWRSDHVTKLRADQMADKAEHAILSTRKFPQGKREVYVDDGVVVASPARVVALVTMIRQHLLQSHTLRLSAVERESKMAALYAFITSERCGQLLRRIDKQAEDLEELQAKEIAWHNKLWAKRGEAYQNIQKTKADIECDISAIIGTGAIGSIKTEESSNSNHDHAR